MGISIVMADSEETEYCPAEYPDYGFASQIFGACCDVRFYFVALLLVDIVDVGTDIALFTTWKEWEPDHYRYFNVSRPCNATIQNSTFYAWQGHQVTGCVANARFESWKTYDSHAARSDFARYVIVATFLPSTLKLLSNIKTMINKGRGDELAGFVGTYGEDIPMLGALVMAGHKLTGIPLVTAAFSLIMATKTILPATLKFVKYGMAGGACQGIIGVGFAIYQVGLLVLLWYFMYEQTQHKLTDEFSLDMSYYIALAHYILACGCMCGQLRTNKTDYESGLFQKPEEGGSTETVTEFGQFND